MSSACESVQRQQHKCKCKFISVAGNAKTAAVDKVRYVVITKGLMFLNVLNVHIPFDSSPVLFIRLSRKCECVVFLSNVRKYSKPSGAGLSICM